MENGHTDECESKSRDILQHVPEKLHPDDWVPSKKVSEVLRLHPDKWDAVKPSLANGPVAGTSANPSGNIANMDGPVRKHVDKKKLAFEEIIQQLEDKIKSLTKQKDFTTFDPRLDLKFVQRQTRYSPDVILNRRIVEKIVKFGVAHVFLHVWRSVQETDYFDSKNTAAFKNLQTVLSIIWNCTDKSISLCDSLVRAAVIQDFLGELASDKLKLSDLKDENTLYLVKAYLGILHNLVRLFPDCRKLFRNSGAIKVLQCYLHSGQPLVKTKTFLILSYIINEDENDLINATDENIDFIIKILCEALSSENHFSQTYAFWATEIACGLNHLAVNDANKHCIAKLGALPLYLKLLQSDSVEEQNLGAAGLWILAFKDENKFLIREEPGCMEVLQRLCVNSPTESIRRAARGALWVLRSAPERPPSAQSVQECELPHVMISYQWHSQKTMLKVYHYLRMNGFKTWMDVDNMSGSTLEAMALAVERAAVVLVGLSQAYKDSPSCRTEAEYTYSRRKDVIPILLQPNYAPDGWLGALVGARIFFDFTSEDNVNTNLPRLIRELGNRGRLQAHGSTPQSSSRGTEGQSSITSPGASTDLSVSSSTSSLHSYPRSPTVDSWSPDEVQEWLHRHQLGNVADRLEEFTGELLLQYKKMMQTAPEFFYSSLERQLKLDLITSLKFAKALENIS